VASAVFLARCSGRTRLQAAAVVCGLLAWLAYTRVFATLQAAHLVLPPCPFYVVTGHPCPFCGGTRSFASMWRGELGVSAGFYPAGPLLFLGTLAAALYGGTLAVTGRALLLRVKRSQELGLLFAGAAALGVNWTLKLAWLGN
jgi:Protein of unknown function (DUF2752)